MPPPPAPVARLALIVWLLLLESSIPDEPIVKVFVPLMTKGPAAASNVSRFALRS